MFKFLIAVTWLDRNNNYNTIQIHPMIFIDFLDVKK